MQNLETEEKCTIGQQKIRTLVAEQSEENFLETGSCSHPTEATSVETRSRMSSLCLQSQDCFRNGFPSREELKLIPQSAVYFQGCIQRLYPGLIDSWETRTLVLTNSKLYFFENPSKTELTACVNIKHLNVVIEMEERFSSKGSRISLVIEGFVEKIHLRSSSVEDLKLWAQRIEDVIELRSSEEKVRIKNLNRTVYEEKDFILEEEFLRKVETGDILLASCESSYARMQKFLTSSDFNHVAILFEYKGRVKVLQANEQDGVQIYDWNEYLRTFKEHKKLAWRRLKFEGKSGCEQTLKELAKKYIGNGYALTAGKLIKRKSNEDEVQEKREFFCSELVAKIYKMIGLLDQGISSGRYWPINFTSRGELLLREGAHLAREKTILLRKHLKL